jgi:thiol-disulfide isomerase/thioredoxin
MKLLFFKAPWCSACHAVEFYVPENYTHIDCDKDADMPIKYGVKSLPVFMAIDDDGNELGRIKTTSIPVLKNWEANLEAENG